MSTDTEQGALPLPETTPYPLEQRILALLAQLFQQVRTDEQVRDAIFIANAALAACDEKRGGRR